ncbi:DNA helicase Rep [Oceanisphaera pacifica]|uniref:ATP-dependent DNA helicase Rep n=1 Tax=Oceanisphaera pacifica TaxID=2818389 RepID=A0ABS3NIW3_9GAMM|nr:DNA helicase Rep [Oceanisphaera pacifica]MBO1520156.1 DNA helicase Rep [Oceanisphaera pacifica]
MKLNPAQDQAVHFIGGPCLVLAGAGSGKTRVITNKIAYLVRKCDYKARNIAAVTFTNKAAREMKERVLQTLSKSEARGLMVSTFHSLGLDIIRREHKTLNLKAGFTLFDDQDQLALLKDLTEQELDGDKEALSRLVSTISNWKNDLVLPTRAARIAQDPEQVLFAECYARYQRQMKAYNALDFDDLILMPTLLLKTNDEVRQFWQNKIRYLLVDEYQDTNASQYELVKLIAGERARFTVVGDDDQSIYSWRGARPQNLVLLKDDYPQLKVIMLEQNYRSRGQILQCANILIANNPHDFEKKLFSDMAYEAPVRVLFAKNEEHEAERVVAEIMGHKFMNGAKFGQYAILYRGNHQSRLLEKQLMTNRIPYKISGGTSFFSRTEVKDMMAYLRLLVNPDDDNAFLRVVNTPRREIGPTSLEKLGTYANSRGKSLFAASFEIGLEQTLDGRGLMAVRAFCNWLVRRGEEAARGGAQDAVRDMIKDINYEEWLYESSPSPRAAEMRMQNVSTIFKWVSQMLEGSELEDAMTLPEVVIRLTLRDMMERGEDEDDGEQVQLMTLHSSKGLEFPYVFMVGMEEGLLPHQSSIDEDNIEEERRLAYVGITRAQQALTFTLCRERRQYGEQIRPEPSRFLLELPQQELDWEHNRKPPSETERMEKGQASVANLRAMFKK